MLPSRFLALSCLLLLASCAPDSGSRRQAQCTDDADCELPALCGEDSHCALPAALPAGEPCLHDAHCESEACRDLGQGTLCVLPCTATADCPPAQLCLPIVAQGVAPAPEPALQLLCAPAPAGDHFLGERCAGDQACQSGLCFQERCAAPCGACPGGFACTAADLVRQELSLAVSLCTPAPLLAMQELGPVVTPAAGAAPLTFSVDAAAGPFVLTAHDRDDLWVMIRRFTAPDGTVLLDLDHPEQAVLRAYPYHGVATLLVPGSDAASAQLQTGSYSLLLGTYDPVRAREGELVAVDGAVEQVTLARRRLSGAGGLLDLTLHFAPATGLTAAAAPEEGLVRQTLGRLDSLLRSRAGVALGDVRYRDLSTAADGNLSGDQARELCRSYSQGGASGVAIDLLWVSGLDFVDGGFAGAIPGPAGVYGTNASGILVEKYADYQTMAALLAHELGHYLGLWHTTDLGGRTDQISDTPACASGTEVNSCPDRQNLMFPLFLANGALELSAGQAQVVRGNPLLYQLTYPDVCGAGVAGVDLSPAGFASGDTRQLTSSAVGGSCGGALGVEQVHLLRVQESPQELELRAQGHGFAPVLHVRHGSCTEAAAEVACTAAADNQLAVISLSNPPAGAYYIFVDADDSGGRYELSLRLTQ